jgi:HAD superfamily phosphoserine phosphatase-like hydrolase
VSERVWAQARGELFPFVLPLTDFLRNLGFRVLVISGSPQEVVDALARHIGAHTAWGSTFELRDSIFTGTLGNCPGMVGGKVRILREHMMDTPIDLNESVAIGDSITDRDLFEMVGRPFIFEPNRELVASLRRRGARSWPIVHRNNILEVLEGSLGRTIDS